MKITKYIEVEVTTEDILEALDEALAAAIQKNGEAVNIHVICRTFNYIGKFLNAFSDEHIARLNEAQRKTIGDFLNKAAARFINGVNQ